MTEKDNKTKMKIKTRLEKYASRHDYEHGNAQDVIEHVHRTDRDEPESNRED